jgi:hypothetical protein
LELIGDTAKRVPAYWVELPIGVEEADYAFWLLEGSVRTFV